MTTPRPYASLLAKGEDRRQRILRVAQRLLTRNGWRSTTLAQIAREAGVSPAGLLHHFPSKDQLLHAVLDARDAADLEGTDLRGDLIVEIGKVAERIERSPELVGTFVVMLVENLMPDAPLHDRLLDRWKIAVGIVADIIRRNQEIGRYRPDLDPDIRAIEIVAFINGMEISWLLDHSIPLTEVFNEYTRSLARDLRPDAQR
ncbi:TetR/AcrR family transcriptional regulator [Nocardia blacklockiae]|uniref:TetR/AcrR family transcriptional regulator n=1 Tax=Nocardia blacklockiae TaxID=480036 RepID=UPI001895AB4F|nr:TetR/AcrR family transcriptional regulator [Nocardia blacklockiae]MBF6170068.1 TetR/AcrR family transcriptional regulator [Nocardia blacklockiae]